MRRKFRSPSRPFLPRAPVTHCLASLSAAIILLCCPATEGQHTAGIANGFQNPATWQLTPQTISHGSHGRPRGAGLEPRRELAMGRRARGADGRPLRGVATRGGRERMLPPDDGTPGRHAGGWKGGSVGGDRASRSVGARRQVGVPVAAPSYADGGSRLNTRQPSQRHATRISEPSPQPLPTVEELLETKARIEGSCRGYGGGDEAMPPPRKLAVVGLPNSGTNAVRNFLWASLPLHVDNGIPGLWKHMPPFHPNMTDKLLESCRGGPFAMVFTVRHPVAWLLSQTVPDHAYGHECSPAARGRRPSYCVFKACQSGTSTDCRAASPPGQYQFPTLLNLWTAYATVLPTTARAYVQSYEELLESPEQALSKITRHFGLTPDAANLAAGLRKLRRNARPWDRRHRHHNVVSLVSLSKWRHFSEFYGSVGAEGGKSRVSCERASENGLLMRPAALRHLSPGFQNAQYALLLRRFNYTGVSEADALAALDICSREDHARGVQ